VRDIIKVEEMLLLRRMAKSIRSGFEERRPTMNDLWACGGGQDVSPCKKVLMLSYGG
jgi:hypothetical protein